jgi:hypothetical protein
MNKKLFAGIAAGILAAAGLTYVGTAAQTTQLSLVCPAVTSPVEGQTVTCVYKYVDNTVPTTTTPQLTTTTTTTTTVNPTTTTSASPVTLLGWQLNENNVGLRPKGLNCSSLPEYSGPIDRESFKPLSGAVISGKRISRSLDLTNGNITIENSCIMPKNVGYHNGFLVTSTICSGNDCWAAEQGEVIIRDSEISGAAMTAQTIAKSCAFHGVGALQRNYMHSMGSGICFLETGTKYNALAEQNYVTKLRAYGNPVTSGSHNESATIRDFVRNPNGRTVKFINNKLDSSGAGDNETGSMFIQPWLGSIYNGLLQGNHFIGGGWNLYIENHSGNTYGDMQAINNRFTVNGYGASAVASGPGWKVFQENYRYDATKPDGKGIIVK